MEEASDTTSSKLSEDGITMTDCTGSILFAGIFTESEDASTVNTTIHDNDEAVQVTDSIYSDSENDEGSN